MATNRTAINTITGYYHQFDCYISALLRNLDPNTAICIKSIKNVNISTADKTTLVPCKYYAKSEFLLSLLWHPTSA